MILGVISDTHGLLRPSAVAALRGSDVVLHAGDVGAPEILNALREIAPVRAVRGNTDHGRWADELPETCVVQAEQVRAYMIHDLKQMTLAPWAAQVALVVSGHTHKPLLEQRQGVTYLNPGSAGPRRFRLPISLARVTVSGNEIKAEFITLE